MDCRNTVGLATNENVVIEANSRGGTLGPADIDFMGADSTLWSSISWIRRSSSRQIAR